ncbi:hypothetical protein [Ottowia sp.]|uniref:hypothetical protein n=1 Tax=Ottowia sp. TaxID=1898956 RepID=UPI002600BCDC|nr:hypothetical protein [Ottowia sp.]MBK6616623.1 hypothetical protein [Ottowia sp.]
MYVQDLGLTIATATVHSASDLVDVSALFSDEAAKAIEEALATGYSDIDTMIEEAHCIKLVRRHLAQARWEHEQDLDADACIDAPMAFPLTFTPASRRH